MNKIIKILYTFLLLSISGLNAQQTINGSFQHDGIERNYILYIPASYNPGTSVPLLISFHGYTSSATVNFGYTKFKDIADTAGFILIHPQGTLLNGITHWNVGGWTLASTTDDISFTEALIDTISNHYNINQERIYATGMSNGGFMSYQVACRLSDRFAAIASVTGSMTPQIYDVCSPVHPTPIIDIHGTADGVVPYEGNSWSRGIQEVLNYWIDYNNCIPTPIKIKIDDINLLDNSTVEHIVYEGGDNGVATEQFKVYGGGHNWPGANGNMDISASIEVWKFLSRYSINGLIDTTYYITELIDTTSATDIGLIGENLIIVSPNPASDKINIEMELQDRVNCYIYSTLGEMVLTDTIDPDKKYMDISDLSPGIYIIKIGNSTVKLIKAK